LFFLGLFFVVIGLIRIRFRRIAVSIWTFNVVVILKVGGMWFNVDVDIIVEVLKHMRHHAELTTVYKNIYFINYSWSLIVCETKVKKLLGVRLWVGWGRLAPSLRESGRARGWFYLRWVFLVFLLGGFIWGSLWLLFYTLLWVCLNCYLGCSLNLGWFYYFSWISYYSLILEFLSWFWPYFSVFSLRSLKLLVKN
jgi:hypothetical protein